MKTDSSSLTYWLTIISGSVAMVGFPVQVPSPSWDLALGLCTTWHAFTNAEFLCVAAPLRPQNTVGL